MEKRLIGTGMFAGAIAGLLAFVFARIFAEPEIQNAIDYESGRDTAQELLDRAAGLHPLAAGEDPFSRAVQGNVGIGVGIVAVGIAMGTLFAVAYSICLGRTGGVRPRPLALLVGAFGLLGFYLVPFVKYPANPPSIGHEETIGARTELYLVMLVASIGLLVAAAVIGQRLRPRFGTWTATLIVAAGYLVLIGVVMLLLPSLGELDYNQENFPGNGGTETPQPLTDPSGKIVFPGFSADLLFRFRAASIGTQVVLWTGLSLIFAPIADRMLRPPARWVVTESVPVA